MSDARNPYCCLLHLFWHPPTSLSPCLPAFACLWPPSPPDGSPLLVPATSYGISSYTRTPLNYSRAPSSIFPQSLYSLILTTTPFMYNTVAVRRTTGGGSANRGECKLETAVLGKEWNPIEYPIDIYPRIKEYLKEPSLTSHPSSPGSNNLLGPIPIPLFLSVLAPYFLPLARSNYCARWSPDYSCVLRRPGGATTHFRDPGHTTTNNSNEDIAPLEAFFRDSTLRPDSESRVLFLLIVIRRYFGRALSHSAAAG
ncbi:hypothetical protein KQX54_017949 [Cotesia glomerata]|uniref:Uncharacterized protein n=1 Tax=Cotesia glomerata TaxID=32391 RepID=A0AAV7J0C4_COTGL|nr:hypothetical protein KQX54_017949 [Cotesia glomerata]